jgi:excisionase family DNA binding protein
MKRTATLETVSVRQAAQRLNCTLKWVYDLLYSGRLPGQKVGGKQWRIPLSAVNERIRARSAS